jgi:hypothetical protein
MTIHPIRMEALPRRDYNRQLWRQAAAGMGWKVHLMSVAVAAVPAAIRHLTSGRSLESDWPLVAGLAFGTFIFTELVLFLYRRVSVAPHEVYLQELQKNVGHDAEIAALRAQVEKLPMPRLMLTYTVESLKGFEDEVSNPPVLLHNEGNAAAVEGKIDPLQLTTLITVTFATMQRVAAQETAAVPLRVEIRTESGGWELDINDKHFGLAIQRANVELAHRNVKTQHGSRRWPMTVRYYDAGGAAYTQNYELTLNVASMKAWTVFIPPA